MESEQRCAARRAGRAVAGVGAVIGTAALLAPGAQAATFQVTNTANAGTGSLRDALSKANANKDSDTVTFASSVTGQINLATEIPVNAAVSIVGPGASQLTIDGGNATRLFNVNTDSVGDPGDVASFSKLTLARGRATSGGAMDDPRKDGAAIAAVAKSRIVVADSVLTGNHADHNGGAISVDKGGLTLSSSTLSGNTADGTVISNGPGGTVIAGGYGGAVSAYETVRAVTVTDSTFTENHGASGAGLALYNTNNRVDYYDPTSEGNVTIQRSTFAGNIAASDGGGIWVEDTFRGASVTVRESTLSDNSAVRGGGGIAFSQTVAGPSQVLTSTITGNTAAFGGGVLFADTQVPDQYLPYTGSFAVKNSTISANHATASGGGVWRGYPQADSSALSLHATVTASSTVIADNDAPATSPGIATTAPDAGASIGVAGDLVLGNSLLENATAAAFTASPAGTVITDVDPQLGPLANHGTATTTRLPSATSPLLDAGVANGEAKDQRGRLRANDLPAVAGGPGSDGTDIGAVELYPNIAPTINVPSSLPVRVDTTTTVTGVNIVDPDDDATTALATFQVTPAGAGTLSTDMLSSSGSGTETVSHTGGLSQLNEALASGSLKFTPAPGRTDDATLTVRYTDGDGNAGGEGGDGIGAPASFTLDLQAAPAPVTKLAPPPPAPTITPIPDGTPLVCSDLRIALRPVATKGGVALTGVTLSRFAGLQAALYAGATKVGSTTVKADGTFAAIVPKPAKKDAGSTSYHAVVGDVTSLNYKLSTNLAKFTIDGTKLSARVTGPAATRPKKVALYVQNSCAKRTKVGILTVASNGMVRANIKRPKSGFAVYRISTQITGTAKGFLAPSAFVLR